MGAIGEEEKLVKYRRRLPHWRLKGSIYFVTWRLQKIQPHLTPGERSLVVSALKYFDVQRYELLAYVVMPDHVHVLVQPLDDYALQDIVRSWKSYASNRLQRLSGRRGSLWQDEYFDRIVRDEKEFLKVAEYILKNPLYLCADNREYLWAGEKVAKALGLAGTEARPTDSFPDNR